MQKSKTIGIFGFKNIGGGNIVIFEHALRITRRGNATVYIILEEKFEEEDFNWFPYSHEIKKITFVNAIKMKFDSLIASFWPTCYKLYKIEAKNYFYFNQSIESKFYPEEQELTRNFADSTYLLGLNIITEATWIQKYLLDNFQLKTKLVRNGINKNHFKVINGLKSSNKFRLLVEGPLGIPYKNVERTIEICKKSKADEIWLLTSSDISSYPNIDKVFSRIPISETYKIYNQCDVLVKLSTVEGMFGPPLEMFHCGGTAITYNVSGFDEYIIHNENALVAQINDENKVLEFINFLKDNPFELKRLKKNALKTASNWEDWEISSVNFENAIIGEKENGVNQKALKKRTEILLKWNDLNQNSFSQTKQSLTEKLIRKVKGYFTQ
jgi:glycosyltransferase involved in cell wall biosynthesis